MKKRMEECSIHGWTLHRCKRKYWRCGKGKNTKYADRYDEKCFKCILEGRYKKKVEEVKKQSAHISCRTE